MTLLNPAWLDSTAYIAFLNRGFPRFWNRAAYEWYVRRDFNGMDSDLLVRAEGTRVLAGVSLSYRQVCVGAGAPITVCIASAGVTLPSERGRGHYAKIMNVAVELCRERGCAAMLGFVMRDNASGRGLVRIGARAIPSFYVLSDEASRSTHGARAARRIVARDRTPWRRSVWVEAAHRRTLAPAAANAAMFHYAHLEDWRRQFIDRPHEVYAVSIAHDSLALMEHAGGTDRLQWLECPPGKEGANIAALAAASAATGRRFFLYTLSPLIAQSAKRMGLKIRDGFMMLQPTGYSAAQFEQLAGATWQVQSGDRL